MSNELAGIGGYASLMKSQKNPYDRNISTTQSVLNSMPKDGGVTGLEGLGKIPLMFQLGQDTASAQQFDEQKAVEEKQTMQGIMDYQRKRDDKNDIEKRKGEAIKTYLELAGKDMNAANYFAENDPVASAMLPKGIKLTEKMDKNGWLVFDQFSEDGTKKDTTAINIGGIQAAQETLKAQGKTAKTLDELAEAMPPGWAIKTTGAAKAATDDKFSIHGGHKDGQHATFKMDNKTGATEVIGQAPIKVAGNGEGKDKLPKVEVIQKSDGRLVQVDTTTPEGRARFNAALKDGERIVTDEVKAYNRAEGRNTAENVIPKPQKQGTASALLSGKQPAALAVRVDTSRPVQKDGVVGYRQLDGSVLDATGRRLN